MRAESRAKTCNCNCKRGGNMTTENRVDPVQDLIDWLNRAVSELHQHGAPGTGHQRPCFTCDNLGAYAWEENSRALHVYSFRDLIKVTLVLMDVERPKGIEVVLRRKNGRLIDSAPFKLSDTNPREMWCDLRFSRVFAAITLEFCRVV